MFVILFLSHFVFQIIYNRFAYGVLDLRRGALLELLVMPALLTIGFLAGASLLRLPMGGAAGKDC